MGYLGDSVVWASELGLGHDLIVCEFEPRIGLCADSSEPGAWSLLRILCLPVSLFLPHLHSVSLSLSLKNKDFLKN